ncbi:trypsin-like peptidase domain-containing protein [Streptomyces sp. NPDC001339]|uniref:trypsin-like peptidase domain-containing protein n=1 Tax=Streptomyces sp. NPDC001339 TaxID=3364563 RepID=UPI00369561C9
MISTVGGASEPAGFDAGRAVQIIVPAHRGGAGRRGSGYQITRDVVLTAAHAVGDAVSVQVRFVADDGSTREVHGETVFADSASDIALLKIADESSADGWSATEVPAQVPAAVPVPPVRFARIERLVDCEALGFPRFRLRRDDTTAPDGGVPTPYRDTHHALGQADPFSYRRRRILEISRLEAPEYDPERGRSPWEGMSGAAVWSDGCLIGIITEHPPSDGLRMLAASPVNHWYSCLTPDQIDQLGDLIGLPPDVEDLDRLPRLPRLPHPSPSPPAGSREPPEAARKELREAARKLASMVYDQWDKEERRRKVHDPMPLTVRFRTAAAGLFDHWANIRRSPPGENPGPLRLNDQLNRIVPVYRSIPSRRLVVLGAAGSGKTILTLRFVLDWLDENWLNDGNRAERRTPGGRIPGGRTPGDGIPGDRIPGDRIPVIFGLGSWDPKTTSLRTWMCDQLVRDYGLAAPDPDTPGRNLAGALLDAGWILPVLDGFDEIAGGLQGEALIQLNATTTALLLTSRPEEYAKAVGKTDVLSAAAVVQLDELTLNDLDAYLPRASRPGDGGDPDSTVWDPVLARLHERPHTKGADNLATVLTTPLMVAMARAIYSDAPGRKPAELLNAKRFATPDALRKHLLGAFTPAAYAPRPTDGDSGTDTRTGTSRRQRRRRRRHWDPESAQHWLGYLAAHLARLDTVDLAWWRLGTTMRRRSRMLVIGFLAALSFGVTTGIGNVPIDLVATPHGPEFAITRGAVVGLLHGLVAGLGFGLVYEFVSRGEAEPSRVHVQIFGRRRGKGRGKEKGRADKGKERRERRARILPRFTAGLTLGVPAALALVLVDQNLVTPLGLGDGLDDELVGGLAGALLFASSVGLGVGVVLGLMAWLEVPDDIGSAARPSALLNNNRKNVVFHMLVWALVFGLPAGVGYGLKEGTVHGFEHGPVRGLLAGLVFGMEAAFGAGLGYGLSFTAWGQWAALARIWLPLTGRLPWALIAFLDDACERGVLRQAGAVYQFRHSELRDHLAQTFRAYDAHAHAQPPESGQQQKTANSPLISRR